MCLKVSCMSSKPATSMTLKVSCLPLTFLSKHCTHTKRNEHINKNEMKYILHCETFKIM
jgi:hypothetical protein